MDLSLLNLAVIPFPTGTNHDNLGDLGLGLVAKGTLGGQNTILVLESDVRDPLLVQADAIIKIQPALRSAISAQGHQQLEVLLAQLGHSHGRLDASRHDDTATQEERDVGQGLVVNTDRTTVAADTLVRVPVVEDVIGQIDIDTARILLRNRGDEKTRAVEVLELETEGLDVVRVEEEHRVEDGRAVESLAVESGVNVIQQAVTDVDSLAGGLCDDGPAVEFLRDCRRVLVVVAEEGAEGAEHSPAGTEFLVRRTAETTDVGSDHGYLED